MGVFGAATNLLVGLGDFGGADASGSVLDRIDQGLHANQLARGQLQSFTSGGISAADSFAVFGRLPTTKCSPKNSFREELQAEIDAWLPKLAA